MVNLEKWLQQQFDETLVEPNSVLEKAISSMKRHWTKLTLFLCVAGAHLGNNFIEQALKKAISQRKNAYFYKTEPAENTSGNTYCRDRNGCKWPPGAGTSHS
jgi:hypothetical protein